MSKRTKLKKFCSLKKIKWQFIYFLGTKAEKHIKRGKKLMMNEEPWLGTNCRG